MSRSIKFPTSRILAGVLALLMLLTIIPVGATWNAYAAAVDNYYVKLTDGSDVISISDVEITLTNKSDGSKTATESTVAGVATFTDFVEEGETYTVSVATITGYEDVADSDITIGVDETDTSIQIIAIEKITINGIVTDENDQPYEGATVILGDYLSDETMTDTDGKYSFEVYKGQNYTITAYAKEDKYESAHTDVTAPSIDYNCATLKFSVKEFTITTSADQNGSVTPTDQVKYDEDFSVTATANTGFRIDEFKVDGQAVSEAKGEETYTYDFKNVTAEHSVVVTFIRKTYKITFTVDENGDVTYDNGGQTVPGGSVDVERVFDESEDSSNPKKVSVSANPNPNYRVSKVVVDGSEETFTDNDKIYSHEFTMTRDHTFVVEFSLNEYNVTLDDVTNGTVTVNGDSSKTVVKHGDSATIFVKANDGFDLESIEADGSSLTFVEKDGGYEATLTNVVKDIAITVTFVARWDASEDVDYTIEWPADSDGIKYVGDGESVTFKPIDPNKRVRINGSETYTGTEVTLTVGQNADVERIYSIEISNDSNAAGWSKIIDLDITYDNGESEISDVENDGKWFNANETATYSFTASDISGIREVRYSKDNDFDTATVLAEQNGKYTFTVTEEYNGVYYIWAVDNCGVTTTKEVNVKVDLKAPTVDSFTFSTSKNSVLDEIINFLSFGTLCKETIYVTVGTSDQTVSSGINEITLYCGDKVLDKQVAVGDTATFELTEDDFANGVEISAIVTDIAGNTSVQTKPTDPGVTSKAISDKVMVNSAPSFAVITEEEPVYTVNGQKWYDGNVKFTVDVTDENSGIGSVKITLNGQVLTTDINGKAIDEDFKSRKDPTYSETFEINTSQNPVDGENVIIVEVKSAASGPEDAGETFTKTVYIDTTLPEITKFEITAVNNTALDKVLNFLTFGIFFNEKVEITVTAADDNASSGIKTITLYGDEVELETKEVVDNKCTFTLPVEAITDNTKHFDKVISAKATDNVGNVTADFADATTGNSDIKDSRLMIETIDPYISDVAFADAVKDKNANTADANDWYAEDVEFSFKVNDDDSGLRNVTVKINENELVNEDFYSAETHTEQFTVNTKDAVRAEDGSYTLIVVATDNAGNEKEVYKKTIYKDTEKPFITGFDFEPENYVEGSETDSTVEVTDYGFYFKADTKVTISARDEAPSAGIKYITYYTVDIDAGKSAETVVAVNANNQIEFTIRANFKGQIYAKATDNVINVADNFVNPNSAIVEDSDKHAQETHIEFTKDNTQFKANDGTELYANNVPVLLTITDTYSGIREIEWTVVAPYDTANNQSGKITVNNDKTVTGDAGWTQTKVEANLVTEMQKTITVNNNSNNIVVYVKMMDRAGNTSEAQIEFSIDKTNPEITIVYDNNTPDATYNTIYKENRTATITIKERNFKGEDVVHRITNTDGVIPGLSAWTEHRNTTDPDETYYTATITYAADGDYTFDISYSDLAGNAANTIAQHQFTIDKTIPRVSVTYDNNNALNGNYYKEARTATITIVEHNFDAARVNVIGVATDNGVASTFPTTSAWTNNGDTHTATIVYSADSKYSFDIEFQDMAGNSIEDYTLEEFYVDLTAPTLEITGVADKSANNGTVAPIIRFFDTNFDKNNVTITLSGINNGAVNYSGSYADIENGQTFTYADFEKIQKVDDIYTLTVTLTDLAGNETTKTISFSANRFGSVYDIRSLESINGKYLQNEQDLVFTETNVDSLDRDTLNFKLTKNGTPIDLVEGQDYTIVATGGDGQWSQYQYTINKALFADDGRYSITVYSVDAAGNVNENIDEAKAAEISFGIDKTKPVIVPIDFESGVQYPVEMKTVEVEIKDNLVLEGVKIYLNGTEVEYSVNGETYTFDIPEGNSKQNVRIVAVDAAGNEHEVAVEDFLVSTNLFVRWYNNTPLFVGSIVGVLVIAIAAIAFILFGKKKKKEDK